ncbi:hypothetical protein GQ600_17714 [Phytophthora cactorum]|nr:hypothetical protein GQ600_17714 [Phytophthora cactorum]
MHTQTRERWAVCRSSARTSASRTLCFLISSFSAASRHNSHPVAWWPSWLLLVLRSDADACVRSTQVYEQKKPANFIRITTYCEQAGHPLEADTIYEALVFLLICVLI